MIDGVLGMIMENIVAQMLLRIAGHYVYSAVYDRAAVSALYMDCNP